MFRMMFISTPDGLETELEARVRRLRSLPKRKRCS